MRNQEFIIGLTLSELAFLILLTVLIFPDLAGKESNAVRENKKPDIEQQETLEPENTQVERSRQELLLKIENLEKEREEKQLLRSKQKPSCIEKVNEKYLFTTTITGVDEYRVEGQELNLKQLLSTFGSQIDKAKKDKCIHSVHVFAATGLTVSDYRDAYNGIKLHFYTDEPPGPGPAQ